MPNTVFISYCHSDMSFANFIDSTLSGAGISTVRDVRDVGHMDNLKSFMQRISECEYVILVLSKRYLESYNCLYELLELTRDRSFIEKCHAFALDDADIFTEEGRLAYIRYWTKAYDELHAEASKLELEEITSSTKKLKMIRTIRINIGDFLETLSEHKLYTQNTDISKLIESIGTPEISHYPKLVEALSEKDFEKKGSILDEFLIENPENHVALILKGEYEIERNNFQSAEKYLTAAINKNPGSWLAYSKLGDAYYQTGHLAASEQCFLYSIEKNASNPDVYANLAITQQTMGKLKEAEACFKKCIELDPMNYRWHRNFGVFLDSVLGQIDEAESAYRTAIQLNDNDYSSYNNLAILLNDNGNQALAEELLTKLFEKNPIHENGLKNLVEIKIIMEKHEGLCELIGTYITLNPTDVYQTFGWLEKLPQNREAEKIKTTLIEEMNKLNQKNSEFYFAYGEYIEETQQDFEKANMQYLIALENNPDADMLVDYSIFLNEHYNDLSPMFKSGRSVRILKNLKKALEIDPNNQRAIYMYSDELKRSPHKKYSEDLRDWMKIKQS